jgi:dTDP-4-amino-4,6-dideoxygalactose transaminase
MTTAWRIPFNKATFAGDELELMRRAVEDGHISGDGPFTKRCEAVLADAVGAERALLTTSCTHALELAALLLDLREGDEVVVPAFTFVSSAAAFALRGARPVFVDVRPDTLNLDERLLAEHVGDQTRAIVPVHYAGVACAMDEILDVADRVGAVVVEDNAHGLFGSYRGRPLGSFGALAAQSFHETKNVTCGEGGALIVNDPRYVEQAEIVREKGTNRTQFFRGQVDKYTWVALGSSYVQSDLLAAFLVAQLEARERIQAARRRIWERYERELAGWAGSHGVTLPVVPPEAGHAWHIFHVLMPSLDARTRLIDHLRARGILAVFHYQALQLSAMGRRYGGREGQCPVAEDVADRLLRLPFYTGLGAAEQAEVIEAVLDFDAF